MSLFVNSKEGDMIWLILPIISPYAAIKIIDYLKILEYNSIWYLVSSGWNRYVFASIPPDLRPSLF